MATYQMKMHEAQTFTGLGTFVYTVPSTPATGQYAIQVASQVPAGSGLVMVIKQNTSTLLTAPAPTANQTVINAQITEINCSEGDTISVVLSSSVASDQGLNTVSTTITVGPSPANART